MKFQMGVVLACFISLIGIHHINGDEALSTLSVNNWTCTCLAYNKNEGIAIPTNCSSSCDCNPGGSSGNRWKCICAAGRFPEVTGSPDTGCFTSCNCNSGSLSEAEPYKKWVTSKVVVIILLICVIFVTLAIIASVMLYMYRRHNCPIQRPLYSSEKEMSYNSGTNLISYAAASVPESRIYTGSPDNSITGCIHKASFFFRSHKRTVHGTITKFSYSELENATNKFSNSNLIGVGGSSHVYYGHLKDDKVVAVKRIEGERGPDAETIFLTEIELLSRLHHCHVVPLLGYCLEHRGKHAEMLLVFQYMAHGNLRECLDGISGKCLDWSTRVAIALGAARGLEYLHEAAAPRILHRDVKSTNILLDENWRAKITDLGMAKSLRFDGLPSCSSSPARMQGTFGYFAPEYAIIGRASLKSDIFSFGVVLLELICGRHPIYNSDKGEESLVMWATPLLQDSRRVIQELPDPHLEGNFQEEEMQIMAYLAKECLLLDPDSRPTMSEVVQILLTIAPEKSWRRNFSFQDHSTDELQQIQCNRWPARSSPQFHTTTTTNTIPSVGKYGKREHVSPAETTERLISYISDARELDDQDDEVKVDLTEPRFESFCVSNLPSPL